MTRDVHDIAVVVIGRNEGERLQHCLRALIKKIPPRFIVYVDSGSTDTSVQFAKGLGVCLSQLDMTLPFTMSRARNTGWRALCKSHPQLRYIQFLDGDCVYQSGWFEIASRFLTDNPQTGIVSGRRRERFREHTVYNRLADMEWDTPIGPASSVLGDMMVRREVLLTTGGFCEQVIAAEDDEFCVRARLAAYGIERLDGDMSLHDIDMTHFSQWWKRTLRSGHGYAQVNSIHGSPPEFYFRREMVRTIVWGGLVPFLAVAFAYSTRGQSIAIAAALYGLQFVRTFVARKKRDECNDALIFAFFVTLSKLAAFWGIVEFYRRRWLKKNYTIIEYKSLSRDN